MILKEPAMVPIDRLTALFDPAQMPSLPALLALEDEAGAVAREDPSSRSLLFAAAVSALVQWRRATDAGDESTAWWWLDFSHRMLHNVGATVGRSQP
jgi:hypothetical protein